jgi:hypothetical protein
MPRSDIPSSGITRRRGRFRWPLRVLAALAVIGLGTAFIVRLALPGYLQDYVNRTIDQSPDFDGRIGPVEVHLWRGAYTIHDLKLVKTTQAVPVPFFQSPRVDLSLDWRALWKGQARGRVLIDRPRINFVQGRSEEDTQTGADQPWLAILNDLFPFRIDRAEIRDGEVRFRAFHTDPQVNVFLTDVQASIENLTNVENKLDPLIAEAHATATAMETASFEFDMRFDPGSHRPNFTLATRVLDLDVRTLNDLSMAFAGFDFEGGRFDFVIELTTKDGYLEGYARPLFRGIQIIDSEDFRSHPFRAVWESAVGLVGQAFRNRPRDQFGTSITLRGEFDNPRTSLLEIVGNVLRNAFIRAYLPTIEGRYAPEIADEAGEAERDNS